MKFIFALLIFLATVYINTVANADCGVTELVKNNFADNFFKNGGASDVANDGGVDLLTSSLQETGVSMFSKELVDVANGATITMRIKEMNSNTQFGFAMILQANNYVAMGGAGSAFSLNTLLGGVGIIFDRGTTGNAYSNTPASNRNLKLVNLAATNKNSQTLLKDGVAKSFSGSVPHSTEYTMTIKLTPAASGFMSYEATLKYGSIELKSDISKFKLTDLFPQKTAYVGATSSIGTCTSCPALRVLDFSISAVPVHKFEVDGAASRSVVASSSTENSLAYSLKADPLCASYSFNTPSIQVRKALDTINSSQANIPNFQITTPNIGLISLVTRNYNTGTILMKYSITKVGAYQMSAIVNGQSTITPITVTVAPPSPIRSVAQYLAEPNKDISDPNFKFIAGKAETAYIHVFDAYGNAYKGDSLSTITVHHRFGCCQEVATTFSVKSSHIVPLSISTQRATEGQRTETLEFKVAGTSITGGLDQLLVDPSNPAGESSFLSGDGLTAAVVKTDAFIYLTVADLYRNVYRKASLKALVDASRIKMSVQINGVAATGTTLTEDGEKITFKYNVEKSGTYSLVCTVQETPGGVEKPCAGSQSVSIDVRPGVISHLTTDFALASTGNAIVGYPYSYFVNPMDAYSNLLRSELASGTELILTITPLAVGSAISTVSCKSTAAASRETAAKGTLVDVFCAFDPSGSYKLTFTPKLTGPTVSVLNYEIKGTIKVGADSNVMTKGATAVVNSLEAHPSTSKMTLTAQVYTHGDTPKDVTWDPETQSGIVPGTYTGTCLTNCIRAGTVLTATYKLFDKYGNLPKTDAKSVIFASASAPDAKAVVLGPVTLKGDTSTYTQTYKMETATEYNLAISISGVDFLTIKKVVISPNVFNAAQSRVEAYSMGIWYALPTSEVDKTNSWKNIYAIAPYDQFGNYIDFATAADPTAESFLIGTSQDFSMEFTPSKSISGEVLPVTTFGTQLFTYADTPKTVLIGDGSQEPGTEATYTIPKNRIYVEFTHIYPDELPTLVDSTFELFHKTNDVKNVIGNPIKVTIIVNIQPHKAVYTYSSSAAHEALIEEVEKVEQVFLQANDNTYSLYTTAQCTTKKAVYAMYFDNNGKYLTPSPESPEKIVVYSSDVLSSGPNPLRENKFSTSVLTISSLQLVGRSVTTDPIHITLRGDGVLSLATDTQFANNKLAVNIIHGVPDLQSSSIAALYQSGKSVFVAGENNVSMMLSVADIYRNLWTNTLGAEFSVTTEIRKSGSATGEILVHDDATLVANTIQLTRTITASGEYDFIVTLSYNHSSAPGGKFSLTFNQYTFSVVGGQLNKKSVFVSSCDDKPNVCTAGLPCTVCFTATDGYNNPVLFTNEYISKLNLGVDYTSNFNVATIGSDFTITFIPTKSGSYKPKIHMNSGTFDPSGQFDGTWTGADIIEILPSNIPGDVTVTGLTSSTPYSPTIRIKALDVYSNVFTAETSQYGLKVLPPAGTPILVSSSSMKYDKNNNEMVISGVNLEVAGEYRFELTLGSTIYPITTKVDTDEHSVVGYHSVLISPGAPYYRNTLISKTSVKDTISAGESITFKVSYYDQQRNAVVMDETMLANYPPTFDIYENMFNCNGENIVLEDTSSIKIEGEIDTPTTSEGYPIPKKSTANYSLEIIVDGDFKAFSIKAYFYRANNVPSTNLRESYYIVTSMKNSSGDVVPISTCSLARSEFALRVRPNIVFSTKTTLETDDDITETANELRLPSGSLVDVKLVFGDFYGNKFTDGLNLGTDGSAQPEVSLAETEPADGCDLSGNGFVKKVPDQDELDITYQNEHGIAIMKLETINSGVFYIGLTVSVGGGAPVYIDTCIKMDVHSGKMQRYEIAESTVRKIYHSNLSNDIAIIARDAQKNVVDPSLPALYTNFTFTITLTYAKSYTFSNGDQVGKEIVGSYTHVVVTDVISKGADYKNYDATLIHVGNVRPAWPGTYLVGCVVNDHTNSGINYAGRYDNEGFEIEFEPINCSAQDVTKPIYCQVAGELVCVDDVDKCDKVDCKDGDLTDGVCVLKKTCASGEKECNLVSNGTTLTYCVDVDSDCESESYIYGTEYRTSIGSFSYCNVDQILCTDGKTCVYDINFCPTTATCADVTCADGACVKTAEECGARVQCLDHQQYFDGSCVELPIPVYTVCEAPSAYRCFDGSCRAKSSDCPSTVVCPVGTSLCANGTCVDDISKCGIVQDCAGHMVRCPNGECALDIAFCGTKVTCPFYSPILCQDGTCADDISRCRMVESCPTGFIRCREGSCVKHLVRSDFPEPPIDETTGLPADDEYDDERILLETFKTCPIVSTCHPSVPVKCPQGHCAESRESCYDCEDVTDPSTCKKPVVCPPHLPARCGDGSCRHSKKSCPVFKSCPDHQPIRCVNDQCVLDAAHCPTELTCAPGFVLCGSGVCAPNYASCGTMLTCPVGQFRCIDGTCRAKCGLILSQNSSCAPGKIMCPNVDGGIFCATKLENCPQSIVCPAHTPIRCGDMYCAGSVEECNKINVDYIPQSRFSCGNGFWANSYSGCGTAVTCPSQAPVKCWDQSCRRVAADCPQQHGCPLDTPFLCSDGSCVLNPWSCAITQCSGGTVRCPFGTTGGAACVNNISQCVDWTNLSNSNLRCFFGQRCWDGSCTSELRYCPDRACPANMPFMCESGTCATSASKCDNLDGCPWDLPYYCGVVGTCVASRAVCDNTTPNECAEGTTLCKDGSCRPFCAVSNFGCSTSSDKTNVCADKTCVANKGDDEVIACRGPSDAINACPSSRPFRCPGGYCAVSSTRCPVMTLNDSIWSTTPQVCRNSDAMISSGDVPMTAFCDDGSCAYSLSQCPVIKPCPRGSYRCGNGLCKEAIPECSGPLGFENIACREMISRTGVWSQACPIVNTCPPSRPYRCQDGLCAVSRDQCIDDYPVVLNKCCGTAKYNSPSHDDSIGSCVTDSEPCVDIARDGDENFGCPKKSTRCDNGMCVFTNGSSKFTNVQCSTYENFGQANGCAVGETRCGNGKCVLDENECPLHNGCPRTAMYRCNDGSCVADMTTCKAEETSCPQFQCPTGECAETPESCFLANGCPVTDPIRCANGTCKKFAANYFAGENVEDYCAPTNVCDSLNPFLCADGTCVPDSLHCRPILPCNEPCAIRCPGSLKCVVPEGVTAGICPDLGSDPIAAINDLCGVVSTCNPSTPILCPDGSCKSSASQCAPQVEGFCSDDTPIKCWDGHCVSSYHECLYKTFLTFNVGATKATFDDAVVDGAQICPDDLHVCPNGLCVADVTTCDIAIACPNHMSRCGDGSCASECTTPAQKCASGRHPCVDGTCREKCPMFLGCPMETPVSCSQKKVQCAVNISACPEPIRMNSDMLQDILTDEVKQEICEENCNRDVVATPQTLLISQTMSDVVLDVSTDAAGAVRTRVTIPSNSYKQDVLFSIQPVPPVFFDGGVNSKNIAAPFTMFKTEGQSQAVPGTFASTVLSTPFRCNSTDPKKPENLILPAQPMVYTASVDTTSYESKDEVATKIPCQLIGTWDAATVVKADKNTSSHPAKRCAAELKFTDDSFAIAMDSPSCDGDFAMSGVLSSAKSVSEWDTGVLEECLCFSIVQAHGGYSNIIGKDLCMNVKRASLSLSIFFEEGFRATMSGNPDVSKLGSCENVVSYPEQDYDINSYLLTPSTCSASNYASGAINKQDICFGIYSSEEQWECVRDREGRLLTPTWTEGMHSKLATATIDDCTGNAYAFIYSALPPPEPIPEEKFCWWCKYGTLILAICIPIVAIIIIALFALCIFSKNRAEYKAQQEKLNQLQDRAKELDEYAGGLGLADEDGEVVMVANPLVLKMQELQQQLDKCNVDMDTQGKQEEHEIQRLEMQRQRIKDELNRIQAELDKQNVEAAKPKRLEAAPHGGHVLSVAPGGPVSAGRAGPIGASGPVTASGTAGPTSFGAGPTGPMAAPRKAHNM